MNNACPKDDFLFSITKIMGDAFMDGLYGYNQIRMTLSNEEIIAFRTSKGIYCYKVMPFRLKNVGTTYQRPM